METLHVFKFQSYEIIIMELHRLPHLEPRRKIDHKYVNSVKSIYFCVQSICNGECRTDQSFTMVDKVSLIWASFLFIAVSQIPIQQHKIWKNQVCIQQGLVYSGSDLVGTRAAKPGCRTRYQIRTPLLVNCFKRRVSFISQSLMYIFTVS